MKLETMLGLAALACTAFTPATYAQGEPKDGSQGKPVKIELPSSPDDPHEKIKALFGKVELRLREIDRLLSDAGAGETKKLSNAGASGIDELLRLSLDGSRETLRDIDAILELTEHEHPPGAS